MKRQTFHLWSMVFIGMIFQVSSAASKYSRITHNLSPSMENQHPQNMYPVQWGNFNAEPEYQNDNLETQTKHPGKDWIQGLKNGHDYHTLLGYKYLCMKIPNRGKQGQKDTQEKRRERVQMKTRNKIDGRIRLL